MKEFAYFFESMYIYYDVSSMTAPGISDIAASQVGEDMRAHHG